MLRSVRKLAGLVALFFAGVHAGCGDVRYNPYVKNDGNRPIGKSIEALPDGAGKAVDRFDQRFENIFY